MGRECELWCAFNNSVVQSVSALNRVCGMGSTTNCHNNQQRVLLTAAKPSTHGDMGEFKRQRREISCWTSTRRWKKPPRIVVFSVVTRSRMRHETATHLSITGRQRIQTFNSHKGRKRGVLFPTVSNVVGPHPNLGVGWTFCMVGLS